MQLPEGAQFTRISGTAAGTQAVKASETTLYGVVIGSNKEGTVTFYNNAAGTSAATHVVALNNNAGSIPTSIPLGIRLRAGLSVAKGGTTDMLVIYQ